MANHIADKRLVFRIYNSQKSIVRKKQAIQLEHGEKMCRAISPEKNNTDGKKERTIS